MPLVSLLVHVTVCAAPPTTFTVAVNCSLPPCMTLAVVGLTLTLVTADAAVTVIVADPDLLASAVDVAVIV
ncbi:hypothetical protein D3C78_1436290 [compost metagenome]